MYNFYTKIVNSLIYATNTNSIPIIGFIQKRQINIVRVEKAKGNPYIKDYYTIYYTKIVENFAAD